MAKRARGLGRPAGRRRRRERHLVMCNAEVTEVEYLRRLVEAIDGPCVVCVDASMAGRDPASLVEAAARLLRADRAEARAEGFDSFAAVWAVFDVDDYRVGPAVRAARESGVRPVISNPCFEVWLIDHVRPCPGSCDSTRACEGQAAAAGVLAPRGRGTKKRKHVALELGPAALDAALRNAATHNTAEKAVRRARNPEQVEGYRVWTDMPALVEALRAGVAARARRA